MSTLSLLSFVYSYQINEPAAYFLIQNRFWEIAIGCLTFLIINNQSEFQIYSKKIPNFLLLIALILTLLTENIYPAIKHIIVVNVNSFLLIGLIKKDFIYKFFINKRLCYLGKFLIHYIFGIGVSFL